MLEEIMEIKRKVELEKDEMKERMEKLEEGL